MSRRLVLIVACAVLGAAARSHATVAVADTALVAARPFVLADLRAQPPRGGWDALEDAIEEFELRTDPASVAMNPERMRLALPHGPVLEAVRTRFVDYGPDWKSWSGVLGRADSKTAGSGYAYFGYHGTRLTAILHFEGERYQITGGIDGPQRLVRQSDELAHSPTCGLHGTRGARALGGQAEDVATAEVSEARVLPKRIDVMALYPKAYFSFPASEIAVMDFVEDSIDLANQAFVNSSVNAFYNLVHVGPIVQTQPASNSLQAALDLLNAQTAEISTLRSAFGADFVTMMIPYGWTGTNACGVANLPVFRTSNGAADYLAGTAGLQGSALGTRLYSANREGCGFDDFTLAHEFGHNWGMWHDTPRTPRSTVRLLSDDALGYIFSFGGAPKATLMGCNCPPVPGPCSASTSAVCNRIPHFSDPAIVWNGVATGINATGTHPGTNNALMARSRLLSYPFFFGQSTNTPPVASFTRSCVSATRTCSFNASGTIDNGTISSYYWDFGDGTSQTTTGATVTHTYAGTGTFFWVHLLATDNGNQRDLAIDLATF